MATVSISSAPSSSITQFPQYNVQIKKNWNDGWKTINYLEPLSISLTISPSTSQSTFLYRFGDIKREDMTAFAWVSPIDISNYYIKVSSFSDAGEQLLFVGLLTDNEFEIHGAYDNPQGDQVLTAYGLEHILDRKAMFGAYIDGYAQVGYTPTFNERESWGTALTGNRSASNFSDSLFSKDGFVWTHLDIILYSLRWFGPNGFNLGLSGQYHILDSIYGVYDFEGLTLRQILDKLIDRRRGLGWLVWSDGVNVNVHVFTSLDDDFNIDGVNYPENPIQYNLDSDAFYDVESFSVGMSHAQLYDRVVVQGSRVKSCFTVSFADGTLTKGWAPSEESSYINASDDDRKADQYRAVFQRFLLPKNWDWMAGNGAGGYQHPVCPAFDDQARIKAGSSNYFNAPRPLLRGLPLGRSDGDDENNYLQPIGVIKTEGKYQTIETLSESPASLKMLDGDLGVEIQSNNNYGFVTGALEGDGPHDYNQLIFTVAAEVDMRPTCILQFDGETEINRTLVLQVHDCEYWHIVPGTVTGISGGALVRHSGGALRDDTGKLRTIVRLAAAWYGKYRGVMRVSVRDIITGVLPGSLINNVSSAWLTHPVSTIVSAVRFDLRAGKTSIETGYSELDFQALLDIPGMSDFRSVGRAFNKQRHELNAIKKHVANLPVRYAISGYSGQDQPGGSAATVDFIVDNFDRADANDLGSNWDSIAGLFQLQGGRAMSIPYVAPRSFLTSYASGTSSDPERVTTSYAEETIHGTTLRYMHPLPKATAIRIKAVLAIPSTRPYAALGIGYNGTVDVNGAALEDVSGVALCNVPPFTITGVAGSSISTNTNDWGYLWSVDTFLHCVDKRATFDEGVSTLNSGSISATAAASAGSVSYSFIGGLYLGTSTRGIVGITSNPLLDRSVLPVTDEVSDHDVKTNSIVVGSHSGDRVKAGSGNGVTKQVISAEQYCEDQPVDTSVQMSASVSASTGVRASYTATHDMFANRLGGVKNSVVVEVLVTTLQAEIYIDGVLKSTAALGTVEPFGLVGLRPALNDVIEGSLEAGVTQFKAWRADKPEPTDSESGHGVYDADNNPIYQDAYHSVDLETGDVVYNPTALD